MSVLAHPPSRPGNRLLGTLKADEYRALVPRLQRIHSNARDVLGKGAELAEYVYFPCSSVLSVLACMENGAAVEVGTIGNEGFFGIEVLMGTGRWTETTVCQVEGDTLRMSAADFRLAVAGDTPLRRIAQRYLVAYLGLVSQSAACNRLHNIEERFARWVLMTHDRVEGDVFHLAQEFLADMLGVHRPSISVVAGAFQQAGVIQYSRGHMAIINRRALEDASCECYAVGKRQIEELLGMKF